MRVRFYDICKGTRVAVVRGTKLLHTFVGETEQLSEVTFNIPRWVVHLRARHPQGHRRVELDNYSERRGIDISCGLVCQNWGSIS